MDCTTQGAFTRHISFTRSYTDAVARCHQLSSVHICTPMVKHREQFGGQYLASGHVLSGVGVVDASRKEKRSLQVGS